MLPMHMPGHKRNPDLAGPALAGDITEIDGFDDLHDPKGLIKETEDLAAGIYGAARAYLSVNGSTALLESAICACSSRGSRFLFSSNSHISIWHGAEINGLDPVICPVACEDCIPFPSGTDISEFERLLDSDPDIKLALITTPTYEGALTDTSGIRAVLNERGGILIADCSHGAHLGLDPYFPSRPDADIVIMSTHKTLHSPTQTAVMAVYSDKVSDRMIRHFLSIFESSSPSYILMGGISKALGDIAGTPGIFDGWTSGLSSARACLSGLQKLSLWEGTDADPSKLVILTNGYLTGPQLAQILREQYHIETEAAFPCHIIAMTGIGDTPDTLRRFCDAVLKIDAELSEKKGIAEIPVLPSGSPLMELTISEALCRESLLIPLSEAEGKTAAEYIFPYPPGIPAVIPGQKITSSIIKYIQDVERAGCNIRIDPRREPDGKILVCS